MRSVHETPVPAPFDRNPKRLRSALECERNRFVVLDVPGSLAIDYGENVQTFIGVGLVIPVRITASSARFMQPALPESASSATP